MESKSENSQDFDDALPSTCREDLIINMQGFSDVGSASKLRDMIKEIIFDLGRSIDIEMLFEVTLACDYAEVLASLDRGVERTQKIEPTQTDVNVGIAMAVLVRNRQSNVDHIHIVFNSRLISELLSDGTMSFKSLIQKIAHELAHVQGYKFLYKVFPNINLGKIVSDSRYSNTLLEVSQICWEEYYACRLTSRIWVEAANEMEKTLLDPLILAENEIRENLKKHICCGLTMELLVSIARISWNLMKYSSYLIGHLHGLGRNAKECSSILLDNINKSYFKDTYYELEHALKKLWDSNYQWESVLVFDELNNIALRFLEKSGIRLEPAANGALSAQLLFSPPR